MTRETKVGLLVGMGVILLIGIIISDHLSVAQHQEPAPLPNFAGHAQGSIHPMDEAAAPSYANRAAPGSAPGSAPDRYPGSRSPRTAAPGFEPQPAFGTTPRTAPGGVPETASGATPESRWSVPDQRPSSTHSLQRAYALDPAGYDASDAVGPAPQQGPAPSHRIADAVPAAEEVPTVVIARREPPQPLQWPAVDASRTTSPAAEQAAPAARAARGEIVHEVKPGETLYDIAHKYYGNGAYWRSIADYNPGKVLPNGHVNQHVRLLIPNRAELALGDDFVPVASERVVRVDTVLNAPRSSARPRAIEVKAGDTLSGLAEKHLGSSAAWRELLEANSDQLKSAASLQAGMTLVLPADAAPAAARPAADVRQPARTTASSYTVRAGDNLYRIADRVLGDGERWRELYEANRDKLKSPDSLRVGQELRLPS